jgi:hypothetical protein
LGSAQRARASRPDGSMRVTRLAARDRSVFPIDHD